MSKRRSNKSVKRMMVDVYNEKYPYESFAWEYFSSNKSNHFGELVSWRSDSEYPDTVYYGTSISLTASELKVE